MNLKKIWSDRNVAWLLIYNMAWSDFGINDVWDRNWREKREGKRKEKESVIYKYLFHKGILFHKKLY